MKILEYHYQDVDPQGWNFDNVKFGKVNLFVGDTATGKSRLLNVIFDTCMVAVSKDIFLTGSWLMKFKHNETVYEWDFRAENPDGDRQSGLITKDCLWKYEGSERISLVKRDASTFTFMKTLIPKLSPRETSSSLLREEEVIRPIYQAFSMVRRRLFAQDALSAAAGLQTLSPDLVVMMEKKRDSTVLAGLEVNVSLNLYLLQKYREDVYRKIVASYKGVFPFIEEAKIGDGAGLLQDLSGGFTPVFMIKERGANHWVPVTEFSSGMQKVLLILTDLFILPEGSVYLIDEYENSLGVNAIDFLPQFILDLEKDIQFFITSHHPYIINEIPLANWYVFHREGMKVSIQHGDQLNRFGKSKQRAFTQLINDPFYKQGVA